MKTTKTPPLPLPLPLQKKRRNMIGKPWFHEFLELRMNLMWPELEGRYERSMQLALMAKVHPDKLHKILERKAKPTEREFMRLCHAVGYRWAHISWRIWNPEPEEPLWEVKRRA